jgi:hypothetical protein
MNKPKVIYIHIPKAAGTSQLQVFEKIYPPEKIFWWPRIYGENVESLQGPQSERWDVAGGHIPLDNFDTRKNSKSLYISLLREPAQRILSLFDYYSRPDNATEPREHHTRTIIHNTMLDDGLDPSSIINSLKHSPKFLKDCHNAQCSYFSAQDFKGVKEKLSKLNHLIGLTSEVNVFEQFCRSTFNWQAQLPHINKSRRKLPAVFSDDNATTALIKELTQEDYKLYNHVRLEHAGLWKQLPEEAALRYFLSSPPHNIALDQHIIQHIELHTSQTQYDLEKPSLISVDIVNASANRLYNLREKGLFVSYKLLNPAGDEVLSDGKRTYISTAVQPHSKQTIEVDVYVPKHLHGQVEEIRISLLYEGKCWFSTGNASHSASLMITKK